MRTRDTFWKRYAAYVAALVLVTLGAVSLASLALADGQPHSDEVRAALFGGSGLALLVGLVAAFTVARRSDAQLRNMVVSAEAIAEGKVDQTVRADGEGDLAALADAINRTTAMLRERIAAAERERNQVLAILGSMVEGVIAVDTSQQIVHLNAAAARILGTTQHQCEGRKLWEVVRISGITEAVEAALAGKREKPGELQVALPGGAVILELQTSLLRGGDGRVAGAVAVLHDISELRRLEAVRRDFVANVSHELKTPLTAIKGLVESLLEDDGDGTDAMDAALRSRFLSKAHAQTERLSALVTDLLSLSRMESGDAAPTLEPLDMRALVQDAVRLLQPRAAERQIDIAVQVPQSPVTVMADEEAIRQVVGNLLDNAVKYTPERGSVEVRLRTDVPWCVLEVKDTGIGIEAKHHDRVFERFYRVDKARSRELGGTGLGLAIVKHAVAAHRGTVGIESTPGHGSTFTVRLPLGSGDSSRKLAAAE